MKPNVKSIRNQVKRIEKIVVEMMFVLEELYERLEKLEKSNG